MVYIIASLCICYDEIVFIMPDSPVIPNKRPDEIFGRRLLETKHLLDISLKIQAHPKNAWKRI